MTDIVERLTGWNKRALTVGIPEMSRMTQEAAEEIERLRALVETKVAGLVEMAANVRIEQLEAEVRELNSVLTLYRAEHAAEVERLRNAMEAIADGYGSAVEIAKRTLKENNHADEVRP